MTNERYAYLLTVDKKYWDIFLQCNRSFKTQSFVRRNQVGPMPVERLLFYVTGKRQVLGSADFLERVVGPFADLWARFGSESCFGSFDEYKKFVDGRLKVTFLRFSNFKEIIRPRTKEEVSEVLGSMQGFGAGRYLDEETAAQLVQT